MAQSKIWAVTRKTDWDAADAQFEFIKKLEIKQAAIYVLEHYNAVIPRRLEQRLVRRVLPRSSSFSTASLS